MRGIVSYLFFIDKQKKTIMSNKRDKRKHKNDDDDYDDWLEQLFTTPPKKSTFNRSNEQQQSNVRIKTILFNIIYSFTLQRITECHSIESMMVENVQNEDDPAVNDDVTAVDSSFNEPIKNVLDVHETGKAIFKLKVFVLHFI